MGDTPTTLERVSKNTRDLISGEKKGTISLDGVLKTIAIIILGFITWFVRDIYYEMKSHGERLNKHDTALAVIATQKDAEKEVRDEMRSDIKEIKQAIQRMVEQNAGKKQP